MLRLGNTIRESEDDLVAAILKVKPSADMPKSAKKKVNLATTHKPPNL